MGADPDIDEVDYTRADRSLSSRFPTAPPQMRAIEASCNAVVLGGLLYIQARMSSVPTARRVNTNGTGLATAHGSAGVVSEGETEKVANDVVRNVRWRQLTDRESLGRDIYEDDGEKNRPESIPLFAA